MRRHLQQVVRVDVLGESVPGPFGLGDERSEQPVPDDEDAAEVAVEVTALGGMVDPVVRGGVEDELEPAGHLVDALGVDPELVDEVRGGAERQRGRVHPGDDEGHVERPHGQGRPGLAQRGGEVELPAGVVDDVTGPQDADDVVAAVGPVVEEVLREQHQRDGPPQDGDAQGREFVQGRVDGDDRDLPQEVEGEAAEPHADARRGVLRLVALRVLVGMEAVAHHLDHGEQHKRGYRPQHDIGQVRHVCTVGPPSGPHQTLLPTSITDGTRLLLGDLHQYGVPDLAQTYAS